MTENSRSDLTEVVEAAEDTEDTAPSADASEAAETSDITAEDKPRRKPRFYEITAENDIKYKGFLSYRYLKMLGWFLIMLACIGTICGMYVIIYGEGSGFQTVSSVLSAGKNLSVPLLLISGFAAVLNGRGNYKTAIITNAAIAAGLTALYFIVFERYIMTGAEAFLGSRAAAAERVKEIFAKSSTGFISFNIFIDLTLCTLVMFFINYDPKKYFQGKKIYLFRALIFLPIGYEIACGCLKILAAAHTLVLPTCIFPFLTAKPPMTFALFIAIARYFKVTESQFLKKGKTHEDYEAYLKTNHNSLRFSKKLAVNILIFSALDFILLTFLTALHLVNLGYTDPTEEQMLNALPVIFSSGIGQTFEMIVIIPVILLFSYTKTHKNKLIDLAVPLVGVTGVALIYIDGVFQFACEYLKLSMNGTLT